MATLQAPLDWHRDGDDWPNREASRFVEAAGLLWHVQVAGAGPAIVLLHGTGASTHSWRDLVPILAAQHTVLAPDLPGHGFTPALPHRETSLAGMARAVAALLGTLLADGDAPPAIVGHSAGAAIAVRMALDRRLSPRAIIGLNAALSAPRGVAGIVFEPLAKLFASNRLVPRLFARQAESRVVVDRLLAGTGSRIDERGADLYSRLARTPSHLAGAFAMMAGWDLHSLERDLPRLAVPLVLIVGGEDAMVPPERAFEVADIARNSKVVYLRGLGHLAHEEAPERVGAAILECLAAATEAGDG